MIPAVWNP